MVSHGYGLVHECRISTHIVGITFIKNSKWIFEYISKNVNDSNIQIFLEREPTNQYDPNAIKTIISVKGSEKSYHVGYIPRDLAEYVCEVLKVGGYGVYIENIHLCGGQVGKENFGLYFVLRISKIGDAFCGK